MPPSSGSRWPCRRGGDPGPSPPLPRPGTPPRHSPAGPLRCSRGSPAPAQPCSAGSSLPRGVPAPQRARHGSGLPTPAAPRSRRDLAHTQQAHAWLRSPLLRVRSRTPSVRVKEEGEAAGRPEGREAGLTGKAAGSPGACQGRGGTGPLPCQRPGSPGSPCAWEEAGSTGRGSVPVPAGLRCVPRRPWRVTYDSQVIAAPWRGRLAPEPGARDNTSLLRSAAEGMLPATPGVAEGPCSCPALGGSGGAGRGCRWPRSHEAGPWHRSPWGAGGWEGARALAPAAAEGSLRRRRRSFASRSRQGSR